MRGSIGLICLYIIVLAAFITSAVFCRLFLWDMLEDADKINALWFTTTMLIGITIFFKILDLWKEGWRKEEEGWNNEFQKMEQRTIQEMRKDIDALYERINDLQYPRKSISLPVMEE